MKVSKSSFSSESILKLLFIAFYFFVELAFLFYSLKAINSNSSNSIGEAMFDDMLSNGLFFILFLLFSFFTAGVFMFIYTRVNDYLKDYKNDDKEGDILDDG